MSTSQYERFDPLSQSSEGAWDVYEGGDSRLDREVAIKQLRADRAPRAGVDPDAWDFLRSLAATPHEGIVAVFDVDAEAGSVVMQLAASDLARREHRKPKSAVETARVLHRLALGLDHLHRLGRVHGDVDRENVLVDHQGRAMLGASAGFVPGGAAKAFRTDQRHVAPEMVVDDPERFGGPRAASDLYCLGFLGLELLLGKQIDRLVPGVGDSGWLRWHASPDSVLPKLDTRLGDVPESLVRVLERLTAKLEGDRYESAREVVADLSAFLGAEAEGPREPDPTLGERLRAAVAPERLLESPTTLAKAAAGLVAACAMLTVLSARSLPDTATLTVTVVSDTGERLDNAQITGRDGASYNPDEPTEVPADLGVIRVSATGYDDAEQPLSLTPGGERSIEVTLVAEYVPEPAPAPEPVGPPPIRLELQATPHKANLVVTYPDGRRMPSARERFADEEAPPGEYRVEVTCPGYEDLVESFVIASGKRAHFEAFELAPIEHTISILSSPPGATVLLDGEPLGATTEGQPLRVERRAGVYELTLLLENHHAVVQSIEVQGRGRTINATLEPVADPTVRHAVWLRSDPPTAEVVIDGERTEVTPARVELTPGQHEFVVRHASGVSATRTRATVSRDGEVLLWLGPQRPVARAAGTQLAANAPR